MSRDLTTATQCYLVTIADAGATPGTDLGTKGKVIGVRIMEGTNVKLAGRGEAPDAVDGNFSHGDLDDFLPLDVHLGNDGGKVQIMGTAIKAMIYIDEL